jgi:uncharacterized protein YgbK (DUF1537 family)
MTMSPTVRLLADDLTGALDTAAELVRLTGPIQVFWHGAIPSRLPANAAFDSGTREANPVDAAALAAKLARLMDGVDIAYKKIDSLLRGPTLAEFAAFLRAGPWKHCVLAPAFPYQGRATRGGRQYARDATGGWSEVSDDIVAALRALGVEAFAGNLGDKLPPGVSVFDAETDDDLHAVVETARQGPDTVLWCGSGGLAQALARAAARPDLADGVFAGDAGAADGATLPHPILGLFGSDQRATAAQLAACGAYWIRLPYCAPPDATPLARCLHQHGVALASFDLPPGLTRDAAAECIRLGSGSLLRELDPPGTLLAAGGETLRGICQALGAKSLEVQGRIVPGLPRSVLRGGPWHGVAVVSKSGAFGPPNMLRDLLRAHPGSQQHTVERTG